MPEARQTGLKRVLPKWALPAQREQAPREETLMVDRWALGTGEVREAVTFVVRGQDEAAQMLRCFFAARISAERSFSTASLQDCTAYSLIMPSLEDLEMDEGTIH